MSDLWCGLDLILTILCSRALASQSLLEASAVEPHQSAKTAKMKSYAMNN